MMEFREAYVDLLDSVQPIDGIDGIDGFSLERRVDEVTWDQRRSRVARAAGAAASAYARHGGTFTLRNAAYIMHDVDPLANWEMSLRDPEQLRPDSVVSSIEAACAAAARQRDDARHRERGITGMVAAFLRWPGDLREAVGPGHSVQRQAAGVIGVLAQLFTAAVGGALAIGIAAGSVALWNGFHR